MPANITIVNSLFLQLVVDVFYAPVWWYSQGLLWFFRKVIASIRETANAAGLGIWVKNILVPMYGQYDIWGRIVSFIVRFANIIGRALWVLIWTIICLAALLIWIAAPITLLVIFLSSIMQRTYA